MSDNAPEAAPPDWSELAPFLEHLPRDVHLALWGDPEGSGVEAEAARLASGLCATFARLTWSQRPRRPNYDFYPVIGVMGGQEDSEEDLGLRLIGLPAGVQLTALLGAIQAVAFSGQHVEARARIQLSRMPASAIVEVITDAQDEAGASLATAAFGLAVCSPRLSVFQIMADQFPVVRHKYNVLELPHTVINGRVHIAGPADDRAILKHLAAALRD